MIICRLKGQWQQTQNKNNPQNPHTKQQQNPHQKPPPRTTKTNKNKPKGWSLIPIPTRYFVCSRSVGHSSVLERQIVVLWVVGSIPLDGSIEQFIVLAFSASLP